MYYEGNFINDLQNGEGREVQEDGSVFTGSFLNGKKHGKG